MKIKPLVFCGDRSLDTDHMFSPQDAPVSIHIDTLNLEDTTPYRVFMEMEPPQVCDLVQEIIDNHGFYDLILAWHERILNECPNAVKFTFQGPWFAGSTLLPKKFSVSFLTSSKDKYPGHELRQEIFKGLPKSIGALSVTKHRSPPWVDRSPMFERFQYHIAVENSRCNNYFSEKLLDCFVSRTLPLYWGCPNLQEFFNMDGVLVFETYKDLMNLLTSLTPKFYQDHAPAIEDNFQRSLAYCESWMHRIDLMIEKRLRERTDS